MNAADGCWFCEKKEVRERELLERVAVDIVGPLPRSSKGNRYVLSAIDYFTRWPEAYPLPGQEAGTVVDALLEDIFLVCRRSYTLIRAEILSPGCLL